MTETTRYTLVTATSAGGVTILIGSPRDGDTAGIERAISGHREMEREYRGEDEDAGREAASPAEIDLIAGCVLTDEEPADEACIVWCGTEGGWLLDEEGRSFGYAVLPAMTVIGSLAGVTGNPE